MHLIPYVAAYLGIAVFVIASLARVVMWMKMPMHLRWELYPVAHEGKRAHYGGSYLEMSKWWEKRREVSLFGEMKVMVPEILFLVAVKENNPRLWSRTFPFHFGLYLVGGTTALLFLVAILSVLAPTVVSGTLASVLNGVIIGCGACGLILSLLGAIGLLHRRLTELRDYSSPADIFNLVFFIVAFGTALASFAVVDRSFGAVATFAFGLITFEPVALGTGAATILPTAAAILMSALVAYIPLTHMSHFIGKYFAYHAIRWNDTPNLKDGAQEPVIQGLLARPVTWAAPHIRGDGKRTWAEVCTEEASK